MKELLAQHSIRFRKVAKGYARRVNAAYDGDLEAAARDSDAQVAERVRQWEIAQGFEPLDWVKMGRDEA